VLLVIVYSGIRELTRVLATLPQGIEEPLMVRDRDGRLLLCV